MNKFLKLLLSFTLMVNIFSCSKKTQVVDYIADNIITITDNELNKKYLATDIFEDYTIIPLETNDDCLIGYCSKIIIKDSNIYVFDEQTKSIYSFDINGKYKTKIHNVGQGANQYLDISDFTLLGNGDIVILDNVKRLIRYKNDGTPYKTYQLPFYADAVENLNDTLLVFNGSGNEDRVIVWDIINNKKINSFIKYDIKYSTRILKPLIKYKDIVYFMRNYSSDIYNVTPDKLRKKWFIDFGKRNITDNDIVTIPNLPFTIYQNLPFTSDVSYFTETDNFVLFSFTCQNLNQGYPYYVFYSKQTGEKICTTHGQFLDNLMFDKFPPSIVTATNSEQFVSICYPYVLLENAENNTSKNNKNEISVFLNKIKDIKDIDNPVIVLFTLKKF